MEAHAGNCLAAGKVYSNGMQICDSTKCHVCEAGEWQDRFIDFIYGVGP